MARSSVDETARTNEDPVPATEIQLPPSKYFHHNQQVISLFVKFLGRWVLTAIICAAFVVVLKEYDRKPYIEDDTTHIYNAVTSGLTICLSLNIDSSLNGFAAVFKWMILATTPFPPRVFNLILAFDASKLNAVKLLFWPKLAWRLRLFCLLWLFIPLAAQIGTALIGLTASVVSLSPDSQEFPSLRGDGFTSTFTSIDSYSTDIEHDYYYLILAERSLSLQRSTAFAYGIGAINARIYFADGPRAYAFHSTTYYSEYSTYENAITNYPSWAAGSLVSWNAIGRGVQNSAECTYVTISDWSSSPEATSITFYGYNGTQAFTIPQDHLDYITYISDTELSCGSRCTQVYAIVTTNDTADMFVCNSTVGEMYDWLDENVTVPLNLSMPDTQARILAGAIGWGDLEVNSTIDGQSTSGRFQASSFINGSYWAPNTRPDTDAVGNWFVAHFTAATIESINRVGLFQNFNNLVIPGPAQELDVKWTYSVLILVLIPGIQALLALLCIAIVHWYRVPIHDDSYFAVASLLSPVVSRIKTGSLESGSEIARHITEDQIYMPEKVQKHFDGEELNKVKIAPRSEWVQDKRLFRDGRYR